MGRATFGGVLGKEGEDVPPPCQLKGGLAEEGPRVQILQVHCWGPMGPCSPQSTPSGLAPAGTQEGLASWTPGQSGLWELWAASDERRKPPFHSLLCAHRDAWSSQGWRRQLEEQGPCPIQLLSPNSALCTLVSSLGLKADAHKVLGVAVWDGAGHGGGRRGW